MAKLTVDLNVERIRDLLIQLKPEELRAILLSLENRLETHQMMKLAESAFSEWDSEPDLYTDA